VKQFKQVAGARRKWSFPNNEALMKYPQGNWMAGRQVVVGYG